LKGASPPSSEHKKLALLEPGLMQKLTRLVLGSRRRASGVRDGGRRSLRRGRSQEFADHRPYVPGDDLRFLDWHLYGRLDSLWIKLFEEETDRTVQLLVDCSASMEGDKLDFARRLGAALSFVALGRTDRVAVAGLSDKLAHYSPPRRGRRAAHQVFRSLEAVNPGGETNVLKALDSYPRQQGAGIGLLFTDFFYPGAVDMSPEESVHRSLRNLASRNMELHAFHILSPVDVRPAIDGDCRLIDKETGEAVDVTVDQDVLDKYEVAVREWAASVEEACKKLGVGYYRVLSTANLEDVIMRDLRGLGLIS